MIHRIVFVCTGTIFRSLTADVALRRLLEGRKDFHVPSAGTAEYPHEVRPYTQEYLLSKSYDVRGHGRRWRRMCAWPSIGSSGWRRGWRDRPWRRFRRTWRRRALGEAEHRQLRRRPGADFPLRAVGGRHACGACPRTLDLAGHNHISEIAHLGSTDELFGKELLNFIRSVR